MQTDKNIELQLDGLITKASAQTSDTGEEFVMIEGYANTPSADRVRDVIPISTWQDPDALKSYLKNPIILAFHDHEKPIGKMEEYKVDANGLWIRAKISKIDEEVFKSIKEGILKSFSVGFRLKDIEYDENNDQWILTKLDLYEISVVSVPCNQDSVFSLAKSLSHESYTKLLKECKKTIKKPSKVSNIFELAQVLGCIKEEK